ncbi:MAG: hypothetical protein K2X49_02295 [Acetobacteraceae bacterium]|nr:hypothetical protein [Acetobacteraceae bacterium]
MKFSLPAALGLAALAAACAAPAPPPPPTAAAPAPVVVADTSEAVYSVRSVNRRTRQIALNTPQDTVVTIKAGPQVRNFDRIRVNDRVRIRFADALAISMAPAGAQAGTAPQGAVAAERGPRGARPQGALGAGITETVRIVGVDAATGRTTFVRPDGTTRSVTPRQPEVIAFARALRPGDLVNVTFAEGVAVQVLPAA